jgi:5-methylcytosine-specific restriction endonuclease McrA
MNESIEQRRARHTAYMRAYRWTHREKQLAADARHRKKRREAMRAYLVAWRRARLGEVRASDRARYRANPQRYKLAAANRRGLKRRNGGSFTAAEWREKCALLGNVCVYCGETRILTIDHKIPLSAGGRNDITNIVPACLTCNLRKRDRTLAEFLAAKP